MTSEQEHIVAALAERWHLQRDHGKTMEEIFPEAPAADRGGQILAGGGDDPRVCRFGARAAETPDRVLLERLQQLDLQRLLHQADLVQEDRAAVGKLQQARLRLLRVGERAPLEPEQLGLE